MEKKRGFSLTEVLVVISIIGMITAITMSVYGRAKSRALAASSISNMRQIGAALHLYAQNHDGYLPPYTNHEPTISLVENPPGSQPLTPTNSSMPNMLIGAVQPYVTDSSIWFSPLDSVARQPVYYLSIKHELTSYLMSLFNWQKLQELRKPGIRHVPIPPAALVEDLPDIERRLVLEPYGWGDSLWNDPEHTWEGPCRSYYPDGSYHAIGIDLALQLDNCNDKTRIGEG